MGHLIDVELGAPYLVDKLLIVLYEDAAAVVDHLQRQGGKAYHLFADRVDRGGPRSRDQRRVKVDGPGRRGVPVIGYDPTDELRVL